MSFWGMYVFKLLTPIFFFALVCVGLGIRILIGIRFPRWKTVSQKSIRNRLFSILSFLIIGFFTFSVSSVFQAFNCVKRADGRLTLTKYPSIVCFGNDWKAHLFPIVFFMLLYCLFVPLFLMSQFYMNRARIDTPEFAQKFPNLLSPYKRQYYYFELVFMLRKALFVIANEFLPITGDYVSRFTVTIGLLWLYLLVDCTLSPYKNEDMNLLQAR
jgi:hypothetical protein